MNRKRPPPAGTQRKLPYTDVIVRMPGFIALRYLRPRRGRGVLSVVTAIAVTGFAAGVGALILALAVSNGFRDALQNELVGATAQVNLMPSGPGTIADYPALLARVRHLPHVVAVAPEIYFAGLLSRGRRSHEVVLKGIVPRDELRVGNLLEHLQAGSLDPLLRDPAGNHIVLGSGLAQTLNAMPGSWVELYLPGAELTPLGLAGRRVSFQVAGIFRSGFLDFDSAWAFTSLPAAQALAPQNQGNWASDLEFRLDDIYQADAVARAARAAAGPGYATTTWISENRPYFQALQLERLGTMIVIGLVVLVAALNVLIMLTMLVMEKRKEIAVLLGLGARRRQIRRIFVYQGLGIAALGTAAGLAVAYPLAWAANRYHWIHVSAQVYAVDYVPFHPQAWDGVLVAALSLGVAFLATLYPSSRALAVTPAETLRYE
jgi:lipoprotein-releasing system permease protein